MEGDYPHSRRQGRVYDGYIPLSEINNGKFFRKNIFRLWQ